MENNANQLQNQPMLCKKNCGFFGNPSCDGYCSKCYKDHVKKQNTGSAAGRVTPTTSLSTNNSEIKINHESSSSTVTSTTASPFSAAATSNAVTAAAGASSAVAAAATHSIPIPARQSSKLNEDFGMSVPVDMPAISNMNSSAAVASSLVGENMMACSVDEASTSPLACSMGAEKKKRTRCSVESCKRKVGLTGFDCRCGGLFCWEHRYSDKHECKFDYKELGQDQIRKNNPVVVGEKIQKI